MSEDYRAQLRAEAAARRRAQMQRDEPPRQRSETPGAIEERGQIGHSRHHVRVGDWRNPAAAAGIAMGLDALGGQQHPITAGAAVIGAELISRHSTMTDAEQAVYDVLKRLAPGNIYDVWVDEAELLGAMDPELDIEDRRRLLARMKDRRLLVEGAGKWRAVC